LRRKLKFVRVPGSFAVCRLPAKAAVPQWALQGEFFSVSSTPDEVSVVCLQAQVPAGIACEADWSLLQLLGPFPFAETGILSSFIQPLAENAIPIFALATFDTDYVLIKQVWLEKAIATLSAAGHQEQ
jgi:uncharacterized protein